jgi:aminoglycoside phosphotransferase (APT) family kinase protein
VTHGAAHLATDEGGPAQERLAEIVRRRLDLGGTVPVSLKEIGELSNINYVYQVETPGRTLFLKVVPERPKRFAAHLPRERIFSEAEGLRRFRGLVAGVVVIPEVLFIDDQEMALGMSDVGEGRQVLFTVLAERFDLLSEQAEALGRALGSIHGGTRGSGPLRPPLEEAIIRKVIFDGLLAPGARHVFPETWDEIAAEMQAHGQCLVHADLWSKNLLVRSGEPVALVDFEGVFYGNPAFDLGTLTAVALVPAIQRPALIPEALDFTWRLLHAWEAACGDGTWFAEVLPRTLRTTAVFLAIRGFGPFAYSLNEAQRQRLAQLARSLATEPPADLAHFGERVLQHAGAAAG